MPVQILEEGARNLVVKITNDATNTLVASTYTNGGAPPTNRLFIKKVWFSVISGGVINVQWEATANVDALVLPGHCDYWDFQEIAALKNNAGAGVTGNIVVAATTAASYTIILWLGKH